MKKKLVSIFLAIAVIISVVPAALASSDDDTLSADILCTLGLVQGTGNGYELDRSPTRAESLVLIVRLSGGEEEALSGDWYYPFTDVPEWADKYVGWAYANGLATGISASLFGSDDSVTADDYMTFLLRALGYSDSDGDFTYNTAQLTAFRLGIIDGVSDSFTRGDMFDSTLAALTCYCNGSDSTLLSNLISSGIISQATANAVGLGSSSSLSAVEIYERYSSAIFYMECFTDEESLETGEKYSNSSGFFISSDGLAVTNCHSLEYAEYARITLLTGEQYDVESVLYYDSGEDIAVIRISMTSVDGETAASFPYLEAVSSDTISNGDIVYAIGCPLGLQGTISSGIVSYKNREVEGFTLPLIQNTAAISTGSSGGALFNEYGQVIGVTSAYYVYGQSMYLAVPMDTVLSADLTGSGYSLQEVCAALILESETEEETSEG